MQENVQKSEFSVSGGIQIQVGRPHGGDVALDWITAEILSNSEYPWTARLSAKEQNPLCAKPDRWFSFEKRRPKTYNLF